MPQVVHYSSGTESEGLAPLRRKVVIAEYNYVTIYQHTLFLSIFAGRRRRCTIWYWRKGTLRSDLP